MTDINDATRSGNQDPEEIRADIEETRAELGETVNELKERFSPDHLKQQLVDDVRTATLGRAKKMVNESTERAKEWGTSAAGTIRRNVVTRTIINNPVPAALAGIGLAWLILKGPGTNGNGYATEETEWEGGPYSEGETRSLRGKAGLAVSQAKERAGERLEEVKERAGEMLGQFREKSGEVVEETKEKVGHIGTAARDRAQHWKERYQDVLETRPMALVAAAFAAGLVAGFSIPETRREHVLMGDTKDRFLSKVKGVARDTLAEKTERALGQAKA